MKKGEAKQFGVVSMITGKTRPVWVEINLENIAHNFREVKRLVGPAVKTMAVVKADAYGHGAVTTARRLDKEGADCFAVALMNEAIELRKADIKKPILVLGWTPREDYKRAVENNIILTIYCREEAQELARIVQKMEIMARVHLKIDTGMGRIGILPSPDGLEQALQILSLSGLEVEGIFTHLAKADEKDKAYTERQIQLFKGFVSGLEEKAGRVIPLKHVANSAAIIDHPEAYFDMVRPGIILYGLKPSNQVRLDRIDLRQALSLKARISQAKRVPAGFSVSYGGKYQTVKETVIASLPLGYADGYSRLLSGRAHVLCKGQRVPAVGRICMDQFMFDATAIEPGVKQGDVVTLIGQDGGNFISVDEIADILGTINYEVVCMLSRRIPRVYYQ